MEINCRKAELEEFELLLPPNELKIKDKILILNFIPHIESETDIIYYLQNGMDLYMVRNTEQGIIYAYDIEQVVQNGKMSIKDIYTTTYVKESNELENFFRYDKDFEVNNIKVRLIETMKKLPFLSESEVLYMETKINEYMNESETLSTGKGGKREAQPIEIDGKVYYSLNDFCRKTKISYGVAYRAYKQGNLKEVFNKKKKVKYTYKGKKYNNLTDIAKEVGVNYKSLYSKVKNQGMTLDEAIEHLRKETIKKYEFDIVPRHVETDELSKGEMRDE